MSSDSPNYDFFLSYHNSDHEIVFKIWEALAQRGAKAFIYRLNSPPGVPWAQTLESALLSSRAVIVFLGSSGLGNWQKRELYFSLDLQAQAERTGTTLPVVPVLLPGSVTLDCLLLLNTWIDLRQGLNPQAAADSLLQSINFTPSDSNQHASICPYRDLRLFREEDAPFYFGRSAFIEALLVRVESSFRRRDSTSLVAVVGPSGSGKSSLVQAGLIPRLRRQRPPDLTWAIAACSPGDDPWRRLSHALNSLSDPSPQDATNLLKISGTANAFSKDKRTLSIFVEDLLSSSEVSDRLLLVVDQFEEIFTLSPIEDCSRFIESLLSLCKSTPTTLVIILRGDFYGRAIDSNRELSELLATSQVALGPMRPNELQESIARPAALVGLNFEPGLIEQIIRDVGSEPGNLALLEYSLTALWNNRKGSELTLAGYAATGGVRKAISERAESIFSQLTPEQQLVARELFTRLIRVSEPGVEGSDTRRRAKRSELGCSTWSVAEIFTGPRARLLVATHDLASGEEIIDLAHEALISSWARLREWVAEDRDFLRWRQHLNVYRLRWENSLDVTDLLRGRILYESQKWQHSSRERLSSNERRFIVASIKSDRRRRLMSKATISTVLMLLIIPIAWFAYSLTDHYQVRAILAKDLEPYLFNGSGSARRAWPEFPTFIYLGRSDELTEALSNTDPEIRLIGQSGLAIAFHALGQPSETKHFLDLAMGNLTESFTRRETGLSIPVAIALHETGHHREAREVLTKAENSINRSPNSTATLFGNAYLAQAWRSVGDREHGSRLTNQVEKMALSLPPSYEKASLLITCADWHRALGNRSREYYLLKTASQLLLNAKPGIDSFSVSSIAARFAKADLDREAIKIIDHLVTDDTDHDFALSSLLREISRKGKTESVEAEMKLIRTGYYRSQAMEHLTRAVALRDCQRAKTMIRNAPEHSKLQGALATAYIEATLQQHRLDLAEPMLRIVRQARFTIYDQDYLSRSLILVAKEHVRRGATAKALNYTHEANNVFDRFSADHTAGEGLLEVVALYSDLGRHRDARLTADRISDSNQRVEAYRTILGRLSRVKNTSLPTLHHLKID